MQIPINEIYVPRRIRDVDENAVEELKVSIEQYGLLSPITITPADGLKPPFKYTLVCGAHRFRAWCLSLCGEDIEARILPQTTVPTLLAFAELEENIRRKDLTWQELCLGAGKLFYKLLKADPAFTAKRFSEMLQQDEALTSHQLQIYDACNEYPHILLEDTINRAKERLRIARVAELAKEKLRRQQEMRLSKQEVNKSFDGPGDMPICYDSPPDIYCPLVAPAGSFSPILSSALDLLQNLDDDSVDLCVTDPPFFITIQDGRHRRSLGEGAIYDPKQKDKPNDMYTVLAPCIPHFARVLKPGCHCYMFFPIERLTELRQMFEAVGFLVNTVPLIWVRQGVGAAANQPYYLPGSQYQAILMGFAPGERRRLQKLGQSNVLLYNAIPPQHKTHPLEVPMFVYSDLVARSACPGDIMIDPFCGTGNSIVAGIKSYCKVLAAELREDYRNLATLKAQEAEAWLRDIGKGTQND